MIDESVFAVGEGPFARQGSPGDGPGVIVAAVEDSATSLRAVSYAAGLARRSAAALMLVRVRRIPPWMGWVDVAVVPCLDPCVASMEGDKEELREAVRLQRLAKRTQAEYGITVGCALRFGSPADEVARVADGLHADAVIVGCSRPRRHRLGGSVPGRLVRRGTWPVTVVP